MLAREQLDAIPHRGAPGAAYRWRVDSPDGRWAVVLTSDEVKMSHWIQTADLYRRDPFEHVMPIGDASWSCEVVRFEDPVTLSVEARRYPGDRPGVSLRLRLDERLASARVETGEERAGMTFAELGRWLDAWPEHQRSSRA